MPITNRSLVLGWDIVNFNLEKLEMRRWWNPKDFIGIIFENIFKGDVSLEIAVDVIYHSAVTETTIKRN